ncbi:DUF429 domain-containing protein [Nitriliruptoraceae bacterium ZYF776]|nr:DUF429 domain-containing protein [Profundirhabdus halotolerans]
MTAGHADDGRGHTVPPVVVASGCEAPGDATTRWPVARRVVGLDGCRDGWVAVHLVDGTVADVEVVATVADAWRRTVPDAVGIDIPVGLHDTPVRAADAAARAVLGRRAATVFSAPPRSVVDAYVAGTVTSHAQATALAVTRTGRGMSVQAWGLVAKVAEVDAVVAAGTPVAEVHPEVAFVDLAGGPVARKTSWAGVEHRRALLAGVGLVLPSAFDGADRVAPDDVADAAVCAWVADGVASADGSTRTLPSVATEHDRGRPTVVVSRRPRPTSP